MLMSGISSGRRALAPQARVPGIANRRQVPKPVKYKKDAGDRIDDAFDNIKDNADDARNDLQGWRRKGEDKVDDVRDTAKGWGNKAEDKAQDAKHTAKGWANKAEDKAQDAKDTVKGWSNKAEDKVENFGDNVNEKLDDGRRRAQGELKSDDTSAPYYSIAGLTMLVLEVYKIWRPEAAVARVFGFAMQKFGTELAALMGQLGTAPFLMQAMGVLSVPALCGFLVQARQAKEGNLESDSSKRLNFGLGLSALISAFALFTSPLFTQMGGPAIVWSSSVILLSLLAVYKGVRNSYDLGSFFGDVFSGTFSTLKRALTPSTLEGSIYGVFFVLSFSAVIWSMFGNAAVGDLFGAGIASLVPAHREVINLLSRAISAQLLFITVAFVALKELADKKALASPPARLMNFGMTLMLIGFGVLARGGEASGIYSEMGSTLIKTVGTVASAMLIACGAFTIYPESKSEELEDTAAIAY